MVTAELEAHFAKKQSQKRVGSYKKWKESNDKK
jgi:hypothetical protein